MRFWNEIPKPYLLLQSTVRLFIPTQRAKDAAGFLTDEFI